jgi:hypothetical protein
MMNDATLYCYKCGKIIAPHECYFECKEENKILSICLRCFRGIAHEPM